MPTYIFECYLEDGGCGHIFEKSYPRDKITKAKPRCPTCKKQAKRNYGLENTSYYDATPRTVGSIAEKNAKCLSDEAKQQAQRLPYTGPKPLEKDDPRRK